MKTALIYSVPMLADPGFAWRWRAENNSKESHEAFLYYSDCVADATRRGYTVEVGRVHAPADAREARGGECTETDLR